MSISGLISSRSFMDENTPENNQDLITIEDRYNPRCIHDVGRNDAPAVEELEEVMEEQSLTEDSTRLDNFGKPIYQGVGFHRASNFDDSECGEPVKAQHLRLDFSPIEGVDDNEFIVNKCRDFWTFIETVPGITGLRAVSKSHDTDELDTITKTDTAGSTSSSGEPTATDWLKCKQGLMRKAFATKPERCEGGSGDNCSDWHLQKYGKRNSASLSTPRTNISRRKHSDPPKSSQPRSSEEAILLCKQIEAWDLSHPKSMEPPGRPPILSHALMQRQNLC